MADSQHVRWFLDFGKIAPLWPSIQPYSVTDSRLWQDGIPGAGPLHPRTLTMKTSDKHRSINPYNTITEKYVKKVIASSVALLCNLISNHLLCSEGGVYEGAGKGKGNRGESEAQRQVSQIRDFTCTISN
jgi:hypothetical protein